MPIVPDGRGVRLAASGLSPRAFSPWQITQFCCYSSRPRATAAVVRGTGFAITAAPLPSVAVRAPARQHAEHFDGPGIEVEGKAHAPITDAEPPFVTYPVQPNYVAPPWVCHEAIQRRENPAPDPGVSRSMSR